MANWHELGEENLRAAKLLLDKGLFRSSVSRAYYAAYSTLTGLFRGKSVKFRFGDSNPSHDQLLALAANNLNVSRFGKGTQFRLKKVTRDLQAARIAADYMPGRTIDENIARQMVRNAAFVVTLASEKL